jgi:hypothetical protein
MSWRGQVSCAIPLKQNIVEPFELYFFRLVVLWFVALVALDQGLVALTLEYSRGHLCLRQLIAA